MTKEELRVLSDLHARYLWAFASIYFALAWSVLVLVIVAITGDQLVWTHPNSTAGRTSWHFLLWVWYVVAAMFAIACVVAVTPRVNLILLKLRAKA